MTTERELKFSTPLEQPPTEEEVARALEASGFGLAPATPVRHKDRYFDDARLSLSRAGLALRRRIGEGRVLATLKTRGTVSGGLHHREEIELAVEGNDWPRPILDRVSTITAPGLLQPHTVIETERRQHAVLAEGRPVALLAFDRVTARSQHGDRTVGFDEVEIEAVGATHPSTLEAIARALEEIMPLHPNATTKLERVRELLLLGDWS